MSRVVALAVDVRAAFIAAIITLAVNARADFAVLYLFSMISILIPSHHWPCH